MIISYYVNDGSYASYSYSVKIQTLIAMRASCFVQCMTNKPVIQMDVWMSSIQAYKAHKQEGTLGHSAHLPQASLHQWLHYLLHV